MPELEPIVAVPAVRIPRQTEDRVETVSRLAPLGGILSGTGAASAEPGVFANGTLMMCLDPERFLPRAEFDAQVAALLDWVRSAPLAAGATEVAPVSDGHGWRIGRIAAPDGHHWEIGRPLGPQG